jgi:hypothetical protein
MLSSGMQKQEHATEFRIADDTLDHKHLVCTHCKCGSGIIKQNAVAVLVTEREMDIEHSCSQCAPGTPLQAAASPQSTDPRADH